jgi:hypothetical protein
MHGSNSPRCCFASPAQLLGPLSSMPAGLPALRAPPRGAQNACQNAVQHDAACKPMGCCPTKFTISSAVQVLLARALQQCPTNSISTSNAISSNLQFLRKQQPTATTGRGWLGFARPSVRLPGSTRVQPGLSSAAACKLPRCCPSSTPAKCALNQQWSRPCMVSDQPHV